MIRFIPLAVTSAAVLLSAACATAPKYSVMVDAYAQRPLQDSARVAVLAATQQNPMLGAEVGAKIERLLSNAGYEIFSPVAPGDTADLVALAVFGIGDPETVYTGTAVLPLGGIIWSVPQTRTARLRWLIVAVARPEDLEGVANVNDVPWVWYSTTFSSGSSGDLRQVIDYLLVPTFEWLGQNTGQRVSTTVRADDPRVRALREDRHRQ